MLSREFEIVKALEERDFTAADELCFRLDVCRRTLRQYVADSNKELSGIAHIELHRGKGYSIDVIDEDAFALWHSRAASLENGARLQTKEGRVAYLLGDLLARPDWVTIDDLADITYVSRSSVVASLRIVERRLERFGLSLERKPRHGLRVVGGEMAKRLCLASNALNSSNRGLPPISEDDLKAISDCVDGVLVEEKSYQLNSVSYQNLLVHIAIAISRIKMGCYVPMDGESLSRVRSSYEYGVAKRITHGIESAFSVDLPEEEVAYVAIHLAGKQMLPAGPEDENCNVISDEIWSAVSEMLDVVLKTYRIDFSGDIELRMNLAKHVAPLAIRMRYGMNAVNPLLPEIKNRYPLGYAMAADASLPLIDRFGSSVSEDEIGYLALTFALALERQQYSKNRKMRALVVCATGAGSARLMEWRMIQEFGDTLEVVASCDASHVSNQDFAQIDYVFTTVSIDAPLPVPVCHISLFLDEDDVRDVRRALETAEIAGGSCPLVDRELFFPHLSCSTKDEALVYLCSQVCKVKSLDRGFYDLVMRREELAPTAFGNFVAMPHPIEPISGESFVCIGVLDSPIIWNGNEVQVIFLVAMGDSDSFGDSQLYEKLMNVMVDPELIGHLMATHDISVLQ